MDSERLRNEVDSMLALFERLGECDRRLHELLATTSEAPSIRDVSEKRTRLPPKRLRAAELLEPGDRAEDVLRLRDPDALTARRCRNG